MRSEKTLHDRILSFARHNDTIRAVWMNAPRARPDTSGDILQDLDIVYAVTDIGPFRKKPGWIARFGKPLMILEPDSQMPDAASAGPDENYTWLMLFEDGNRIDLTLRRVDTAAGHAAASRQIVVLLDKDHILPDLPPVPDADNPVTCPDPDTFRRCCESFWWNAACVARGLWRREILSATDHLNLIVRPSLIDMLTWTAGLATGFSVSTGKNGKYLDRYLPAPVWKRLLATYPLAEPESVWHALYTASGLFHDTARHVAARLGYSYNRQQAIAIGLYISKIRGNRLDR
ncbi:aminoglycoside 6-adenylyltransferase [Oxalobacter aliiformigenes]|uniref:aminoglycoside 6-adenylyltransferase n=1 Tax=Oxalobacter aliiformigenes TaxID=2946593 RepID=UPI0022AFE3EA|nr:aminoglycoside 6-adenylyltransferase [Oxalobacter aliiformigenes]MCZ4065993.1 aminoglycoside 6-adenylyltransferase [Oxalobacter aliiformigenes]WAW00199.1 aminoglycoside 6-adenylyltransferase [Oxalobacter aliiformigenes]